MDFSHHGGASSIGIRRDFDGRRDFDVRHFLSTDQQSSSALIFAHAGKGTFINVTVRFLVTFEIRSYLLCKIGLFFSFGFGVERSKYYSIDTPSFYNIMVLI